jgi:hypothetical protein
MDSSMLSNLDLHLAWKRMKGDRPYRTFYTHPRLIAWIELDLEEWFASAKKRLLDGYVPHTSLTCFVPKPGWLVRPGTVLDEQDELVFNALVGSLYGSAYKLLAAFQGDPDVAYQLQSDESKTEWLHIGFRVWTEWRTKSLEKLKTSQFVVLADIAGFYENIDLQRLSSDLTRICDDGAGTECQRLERTLALRRALVFQRLWNVETMLVLHRCPLLVGLRWLARRCWFNAVCSISV